ncbi:MAG: hypothetical protein K2G89_00730, partial [Lachnospiraceae bacterium]|nr:hypothetical protein [Lachnospiraceae bacterium]
TISCVCFSLNNKKRYIIPFIIPPGYQMSDNFPRMIPFGIQLKEPNHNILCLIAFFTIKKYKIL